MGIKYGTASFLQIIAPELNDRLLADFLDMESSLIVTMHIQSVDQTTAIKTIKRKITDLDKSKIEEQKKAVRGGYDMDIIPSDLATYGAEAKKLLQDLQSRNERMFLMTFIVLNTADKYCAAYQCEGNRYSPDKQYYEELYDISLTPNELNFIEISVETTAEYTIRKAIEDPDVVRFLAELDT